MAPSLADRYRRWFDYEKDSHAKVLGALEAVPDSLRATPGFRKAVSLMAHIAAARQLWLFRLGGGVAAPTEFFPQGLTLADLRGRLDGVQAAWSAFLSRLDDDALARSFDYATLEGEPFRNTVVDILTQLYGHSLYHRGQVAYLLRSIGAEPAVTDFVFWTREPIAPREASRGG